MSPIKRNRDSTGVDILVQSETVPETQNTDQSAILQLLKEQGELIKSLQKEVKEAKGDTSEAIKDARRQYGKNPDGTTNEQEPHKYKYTCLLDDGKEKVIISQTTIGRPNHYQNFNTGKWVTEHKIHIVFHDGTTKDMEYGDLVETMYYGGDLGDGDFVQYNDIKNLPDGSKDYTFRTEKFGVFTINKK